MDLIEQLEELRHSEYVLMAMDDPIEYWKLCGANNMLDECLEIVWKWLKEKDLLNE